MACDGNNCCCTADQIRDGCATTGATIEGHCCKCLPRRVCVSLFTDIDCCGTADWSAYEAVSSVEAQWCDGGGSARAYAGTLMCGETAIDFSIGFTKNSYNECHLCLTSEALGYTYELVGDEWVDTRVCVAMGGEYFDPATKRAECQAMEFAFPIDLYGCGPATITIAPADYSLQTPARRRDPLCIYGRVCITVDDGYTETVQYACLDDYSNSWTIDVNDDPTKPVTITRLSAIDDPVVRLGLSSYLGDGEDQDANCPTMYARWDLPYDARVTVIGDAQATCVDCRYHCRCLCVTFTGGLDAMARDVACAGTDYDGCETLWSVELSGYLLNFTLRCIGCDVLTSVIELEAPYGTSIIGSAQKSIVCPDQLTATWSLDLGDGNVGSVDISCKGCGDQCTLEELGVDVLCCPYRTTPVPLVLHATVEDGCYELLGLGCALANNGPIGAPSNCWQCEFTSELAGNPCVTQLALACLADEDGNYDWYMTTAAGQCSNLSADPELKCTLISCDPLELTWTKVGVGCCEDSVNGSITVRITE